MPTPVLLYKGRLLVTDDTADFQSAPVSGALDGGGWVSSWTEETGPDAQSKQTDVYIRILDREMNAVTGEILVSRSAVGDQRLADIVTLNDGTFVALWTSYGKDVQAEDRGLFMRHFDAFGTPLGDQSLVIAASGLQHHNIKSSSLSDGGFVILSDDLGGSPFGMSRMVFDANLVSSAGTESISGIGSTFATRIAVTSTEDGGYIASWVDGSTKDFLVQRFDAAGAFVGARITVANGVDAFDRAGRPITPDLDVTSDGGFVATWTARDDTGDRDVYVRRYDTDGIGSDPVTIFESAIRDQSHSSVTHLLDGGYLLAYVDRGEPDGEPGQHYDAVALQRFNTDGTLYGDAIVYSDYYDENDTLPQLELLSDGRVVINWTVQAFQVAGESFLTTSDILMQVLAVPKEGTEGNDTLSGGEGAQFLLGLGGDDFLFGSAGSDLLRGHEGNDTLFGGGGDDTLTGGEGLDVVDYSDGLNGVEFDLELQTATGHGKDYLLEIEHIMATDHDDTIKGDALANTVVGLDGDDSIDGGAGGDLLIGDGVSEEDLMAFGLTIEDMFLLS